MAVLLAIVLIAQLVHMLWWLLVAVTVVWLLGVYVRHKMRARKRQVPKL